MAVVQARITKVEREVDSEWGSIFTDGTPKKMTTKLEEKLNEAAAFKRSGDLLNIEFTEKARHDEASGRTYRNFYYERATAVGSNGAGSADTGIDIVPSTRGEDPDRSWRICLQTGGKLAVATMPLMPVEERDFETQKTIARAWAEFFFFTPKPEKASPSAPTSTAYSGEPGYEAPPPYSDDDIPY